MYNCYIKLWKPVEVLGANVKVDEFTAVALVALQTRLASYKVKTKDLFKHLSFD